MHSNEQKCTTKEGIIEMKTTCIYISHYYRKQIYGFYSQGRYCTTILYFGNLLGEATASLQIRVQSKGTKNNVEKNTIQLLGPKNAI